MGMDGLQIRGDALKLGMPFLKVAGIKTPINSSSLAADYNDFLSGHMLLVPSSCEESEGFPSTPDKTQRSYVGVDQKVLYMVGGN